MSQLRRVTDPPNHHFFGYYEKSPWNADESLILTHEVEFQDRRPTATNAAGICLVEPKTDEIERVAETHAWDFQQGSMLQWLGPEFQKRFVYNDRDPEKGYVARVHDVDSGHVRTVESPVYAIGPAGETAFTLDFDRLDVTRPGYGYAPLESTPETMAPHPQDEGVYGVDFATDTAELLVSLADLSNYEPVESFDHGLHWVNHIQPSPSGERVAFIHRSETPDDSRWLDRLFVMDADGSDLTCLNAGFVSHYEWRTNDELFAWTDRDNQRGFYLYDLSGGGAKAVGQGVLPSDGHCSFMRDGEWLLLDGKDGSGEGTALEQRVCIYEWDTRNLTELCRVQCPPVRDGSLRCDLHPRWDRSGEKVCFDSTHERSRQMYVADVSAHTSSRADVN
jgi:hypothetical protein